MDLLLRLSWPLMGDRIWNILYCFVFFSYVWYLLMSGLINSKGIHSIFYGRRIPTRVFLIVKKIKMKTSLGSYGTMSEEKNLKKKPLKTYFSLSGPISAIRRIRQPNTLYIWEGELLHVLRKHFPCLLTFKSKFSDNK